MPNDSLWTPLISAASGLIGVWIGAWTADRRERHKRHDEILSRQLSEFYGPLLSLHKEIRARSELRLKIEQTMNSDYVRDLVKTRGVGLDAVTDRFAPDVLIVIQDENKTLREVLMPLYRQMVDTFREKMWLAEPETRAYFPALVEFVDVWERVLRDALPREVTIPLGHTEKNLHPFYAHLEQVHDRLRHAFMMPTKG